MKLLATFLLVTLILHVACSSSPTIEEKTVAGYDAELTNYKYPREVLTYSFKSQGQDLRMAYMVAAPEKPNGQTVLLLHGKNFSGFYWEPTIQSLLKEGYRVIAPDQVGFGKSSKPHSFQFSFHALAQNTKALLDSVGETKVHVVGHSMGGMLATRFALMYPESTSKLVLVNPIGLEDWKTRVPYKTIDELYQSELKTTPDSIRAYQRDVYFAGEWKAEYEPLVDVLSGWTKHPDYPKVAWNAALTSDMVFTQPVVYEFPHVKAPTLLIIGLRDRTAVGKAWAPNDVKESLGNYPVLGRQAAKAIPGAKLVELKGVGHMPQVEAFNAYMSALTDHLKSSRK